MVSYRHFERKREIFFVSLGLTLSPHVPRHSPLSPSVFHTASALSAPSGHLPLEGKADDTRGICYQETFGYRRATISHLGDVFKRN